VIFWQGVNMKSDHISIIGGGIAGLSAAVAAARSGRTATIYEKATSFDPIGAGLQLGPNAVRALRTIGAWDAVEPITSSPPAIHMRDGASGKLIKSITLGKAFEQRFGQPYRVAHRADLHAALLKVVSSLSEINIEMGQAEMAFTSNNQTLAADGLWSKTRINLFQKKVAIKIQDEAYRSLFSPPKIHGVEIDCVNLWLHPGGHVVHYPVGQNQHLNLVAVTDGKASMQHFANVCPQLLSVLKASPSWSVWPMAYVPKLPNWTKNNITLIGDAAHGTLPYLAQGAAMALEDAACLAQTDFDPNRFFNARAARCQKLHNSSLRAGKIYHASPGLAKIRNLALALAPERSFLSSLVWLYAGG
jgi:2-polyprenyl-6-methoxyphenol hydroxylase-like FAD-dependent oxidoreductase